MSQLALTFTLNAGSCLCAKLVSPLGAAMLFLPFWLSHGVVMSGHGGGRE